MGSKDRNEPGVGMRATGGGRDLRLGQRTECNHFTLSTFTPSPSTHRHLFINVEGQGLKGLGNGCL